jgi:hypothetical protein
VGGVLSGRQSWRWHDFVEDYKRLEISQCCAAYPNDYAWSWLGSSRLRGLLSTAADTASGLHAPAAGGVVVPCSRGALTDPEYVKRPPRMHRETFARKHAAFARAHERFMLSVDAFLGRQDRRMDKINEGIDRNRSGNG